MWRARPTGYHPSFLMRKSQHGITATTGKNHPEWCSNGSRLLLTEGNCCPSHEKTLLWSEIPFLFSKKITVGVWNAEWDIYINALFRISHYRIWSSGQTDSLSSRFSFTHSRDFKSNIFWKALENRCLTHVSVFYLLTSTNHEAYSQIPLNCVDLRIDLALKDMVTWVKQEAACANICAWPGEKICIAQHEAQMWASVTVRFLS